MPAAVLGVTKTTHAVPAHRYKQPIGRQVYVQRGPRRRQMHRGHSLSRRPALGRRDPTEVEGGALARAEFDCAPKPCACRTAGGVGLLTVNRPRNSRRPGGRACSADGVGRKSRGSGARTCHRRRADVHRCVVGRVASRLGPFAAGLTRQNGGEAPWRLLSVRWAKCASVPETGRRAAQVGGYVAACVETVVVTNLAKECGVFIYPTTRPVTQEMDGVVDFLGPRDEASPEFPHHRRVAGRAGKDSKELVVGTTPCRSRLPISGGMCGRSDAMGGSPLGCVHLVVEAVAIHATRLEGRGESVSRRMPGPRRDGDGSPLGLPSHDNLVSTADPLKFVGSVGYEQSRVRVASRSHPEQLDFGCQHRPNQAFVRGRSGQLRVETRCCRVLTSRLICGYSVALGTRLGTHCDCPVRSDHSPYGCRIFRPGWPSPPSDQFAWRESASGLSVTGVCTGSGSREELLEKD